ncbi:Glucose-6-phosphate isomerase [Roseovarius sp. THAF9]|uniref:glucose-6-phosphate isomerase n=1 Tax=Roseovarius sp. THAF9 TaxID=2587847 RepID=UPI001268EE14|nr:glucose-6-phosphate isomerase [Roseovarius sp. THAF9]QFT92391.1 Glucose-6-phosphate isomerase [Roseovarius sp. THAF9]
MTDIWRQLEQNHAEGSERSILSLFDDPDRIRDFSVETDGMLLDFSKTNIDQQALALLVDLAAAAGVAQKRDAMFDGAKINTTENRAVLHTALRSHDTAPLLVDGEDVRPSITETLRRMEGFATDIRKGKITGATGAPFTDVVNIGIGGSDLGPAMATRALAPYHDGPRCHFVSNVDEAHIADTLRPLDPARTLIIVASKTFTTIETMTNAATAIDWLRQGVGDDTGVHLAAVSTALDKTAELGIAPERVFGFADWVGGRYSLWGPVGLPIMLAIGPDNFRVFLSGAAAMDAHFRTAAFARNLPVLMGLVGVWHRNICGYATRAVLPYDQRLSRLPAYLQQLDMESNGKRVSIDGKVLTHETGPVVWGEPGTNGQHAFYQLLHQGTEVVPAEFLIAADGHESHLSGHHDLLKANCLAQSEALMVGRSFDEAMKIAAALGFEGQDRRIQAAQRTFPGNRPSITLAYPKLTPFVLGQIIALYEHRVFVEGVVWGINSFDQWGVELGKELANALIPLIQGAPAGGKDASTRKLIHALCS